MNILAVLQCIYLAQSYENQSTAHEPGQPSIVENNRSVDNVRTFPLDRKRLQLSDCVAVLNTAIPWSQVFG